MKTYKIIIVLETDQELTTAPEDRADLYQRMLMEAETASAAVCAEMGAVFQSVENDEHWSLGFKEIRDAPEPVNKSEPSDPDGSGSEGEEGGADSSEAPVPEAGNTGRRTKRGYTPRERNPALARPARTSGRTRKKK